MGKTGSLLFALVAILVALGTLLVGWKLPSVFLGGIILLGPLVWFVLARRNIYFTFVTEGTAKIITVGGAFAKAVIQWRGRTFAWWLSGEEMWTVVAEGIHRTGQKVETGRDDEGRPQYEYETIEAYEPWHPFGGLRWIGIWPFYKVYTYHLRWHDLHQAAGGDETVFHAEDLDFVLLRQDVYVLTLSKAETKPDERIPLNVQFVITMRVLNPYRAIFVAPIGWIENVFSRLAPILRGFVANKTLDELLEVRGKGEEVWRELRTAEEFGLLYTVFRDQWGIEIAENGIQIMDIGLPDEYQEAATMRWRAGMEKERRATQTVGTVLEAMAQAHGVAIAQIQEQIRADTGLQKEFLEMAKDFAAQQMAIDGKAFVRIKVDGAEGFEQTLLNLAAAWQRMPIGRGPEPEQAAEQAAEKTEKAQETETEEQKPGEAERKKEKLPPIRENPEEDVRLGGIILAALAAVLTGGGYLLIRFFLR